MFGRVSILELALVLLFVSFFWHYHLTAAMRATVVRSSRSVRRNAGLSPRSEIFWPLATFVFMSVAALMAAIAVIALLD